MLVGQRRHHGRIVGPTASTAILDVSTFDGVGAVLATGAGRSSAVSNRASHLLTGIAVCGVCGVKVRVRRGAYCCEQGHVGRREDWVDELVLGVVAERLRRPDAVAVFTPPAPDMAPVAAEIVVLRARLEQAAGMFADGDLDAAGVRLVRDRVGPRLAALEATVAASHRTGVLTDLVGKTDALGLLEALPLARRRAIIDLLVTVTIVPVGRSAGQAMRHHGFDPTSVAIGWRAV